MQRAVRSSVTAGVAFLGVGVIAASPIAPPMPDLHLPAIRVDATTLAAAVSPIDTYRQVFQTAVANATALVDAADPGVILKQIVANQVAGFTALGTALGTSGGELFTALTKTTPELARTVLTSLASGDVEAATNALLLAPLVVAQPLINLLPAVETFISQPIQNLVNGGKVFADPVFDSLVAVGLLGPVISGLGATGTAVQNVIDAVGAGDPQQVVNAILTAPATVIDGVLNGGYGPDLGPLVGGGLKVLAGGLFTKSGLVITPSGDIVINVGGPIDTLQTLAKQIAAAIKPPAAVTAALHVKALPAAAAGAETPTTTVDDGVATPVAPKVAAKPLRHKAAVAHQGKGGGAKSGSAGGTKSSHKSGGRGHSGR